MTQPQTSQSAPPVFDWNDLGRYKASGKLPDGYPSNTRTFYSPEDGVGIHDLLESLLSSVEQSIVLNMYGYDDPDLNALIIAHAQNPRIYVQISLDKSQAGGIAEKALVAAIEGTPATNVAIGTSTAHAISHLKVLIVDGLYLVTGSTNWSMGGEEKQDNQLTLSNDPALATEARAILDRNHLAMLAQEKSTG